MTVVAREGVEMRFITRWLPSRTLTRSLMALVLAVAGTALVLQPSRVAGAGTCDVDAMRGVYAFQLTGTALGHPLGVVGHATFDGQGGVFGVLTQVWNGQATASRAPFEGTYAVDAECLGELAIDGEGPGVPGLRAVNFYSSGGGERALLVVTESDLGGLPSGGALAGDATILGGVADRLSKTKMTCDEQTLRGAYAGVGTDFATTIGPAAAIGRPTFDGAGRVTSHPFTIMGGAAGGEHGFYSGPYSIDRDCRGTYTASGGHFGFNDTHIFELYLSDGGNRIFFVITKTWPGDVGGVPVNPAGINEDLAWGRGRGPGEPGTDQRGPGPGE